MFKKIFKGIKNFLKKVWDKIRRIIAIVFVVLAVVFLIWGLLIYVGALAASSITIVGISIGITTASAVALGAIALSGAFLVDSETAKDAVDKVGGAVGDAAQAVGTVIGKAASGAAAGLLSSPWIWVIGGVALLALSGDEE